jgi:radical SAM protein with 4Fe4S-binding SPASM domain
VTDLQKIDSHKLFYHPKRVSQWLDGRDDWEKAKSVYPIYMELSPMGACNHRCTFCSVDYIGYQKRSLDADVLKTRLTELGELGIKSIMFAGEGEPTLWKPLPGILDHCTETGIDTSLTTNMVPFTKKNVDSFVRNCSWIKTSINAGTPESYAAIHRTDAKDFDRVLGNFQLSVEARSKGNYKCTIGGQILLLPENAHEVYGLAQRLKDIGVDYLVVKPYTQSLYGLSHKYENLKYDQFDHLDVELSPLNDASFNVVYRKRTMRKLNEEQRPYTKCYATPFFWAYIMASGDLYGCSAYLQNEKFRYGNINENSIREIWEGEQRKSSFEYIRTSLDISKCRVNCRMDDINRYLWEFDHPDSHVNFI